MSVINRKGEKVAVSFDRIHERLSLLSKREPELKEVDVLKISSKVCSHVSDGILTTELDELAARVCDGMYTQHTEYGVIASRIISSNLHRQITGSFLDSMEGMLTCEIADNDMLVIVRKHAVVAEATLDHSLDSRFTYSAMRTLMKSYLMRDNDDVIMELPQHMYMRVAFGIHLDNIDAVLSTYNLMANGYAIHASPTLFNSGTINHQLSSCFLLDMKEDSIDGIYNTLHDCGKISKRAGGIGVAVHKVRAKGTAIRGTGGKATGLVPMLKVFDKCAVWIDQENRRKGAYAMYLEPWHADIEDFIELRKNVGSDNMRARDLFYGMWVPDLFMKRVETDDVWSLMCPRKCPGLDECYGEEFETLYNKYEGEGRYNKQIKARDLWQRIIVAQIETGMPYMCYKDHVNHKSNQKNIGIIRSSNLCTEVMEHTSPTETAVCNLASIALCRHITDGKFDFDLLMATTRKLVYNLNDVIDRTKYPIPEARHSNLRHRPMGIGVQGLSDTFIDLGMPFESPEARKLNKDIFETIYYAAVNASADIAAVNGPYETYEGSPMSQGKMQFDLWGVKPEAKHLDWAPLYAKVEKYGVRNSLLVAPMPTATTSHILGNSECIEVRTSNLYSRRILAGEFVCITEKLVATLDNLNLWNKDMELDIIKNYGSVQNITIIPAEIRELYKTAWEITVKTVLDMAADRAAFIDQSQSLNIHMNNPSIAALGSMHFYGWRKGLKTGMYYLRTMSSIDASQVAVGNKTVNKKSSDTKTQKRQRSEDQNKDDCTACGS